MHFHWQPYHYLVDGVVWLRRTCQLDIIETWHNVSLIKSTKKPQQQKKEGQWRTSSISCCSLLAYGAHSRRALFEERLHAAMKDSLTFAGKWRLTWRLAHKVQFVWLIWALRSILKYSTLISPSTVGRDVLWHGTIACARAQAWVQNMDAIYLMRLSDSRQSLLCIIEKSVIVKGFYLKERCQVSHKTSKVSHVFCVTVLRPGQEGRGA